MKKKVVEGFVVPSIYGVEHLGIEIRQQNLEIGKKIGLETMVKIGKDELTTTIIRKITDYAEIPSKNTYHIMHVYKRIDGDFWKEKNTYLVNGIDYKEILSILGDNKNAK
ncbi:hypothetical protein CL621_00880 [archaeon]|nr:hypothetical protein [archaeon]